MVEAIDFRRCNRVKVPQERMELFWRVREADKVIVIGKYGPSLNADSVLGRGALEESAENRGGRAIERADVLDRLPQESCTFQGTQG